jgi:hypothetical protein
LPDYLTLDQAQSAGHVRLEEVSGVGRINVLRVINSGRFPVLILDGEELIGAKQNRIANVTVLVPPQRSLRIPVSCVRLDGGLDRPIG